MAMFCSFLNEQSRQVWNKKIRDFILRDTPCIPP